MKRNSLRKLTLSRESLRLLDHPRLHDVVGGTDTCMSICGDVSGCMRPTKCFVFEEE